MAPNGDQSDDEHETFEEALALIDRLKRESAERLAVSGKKPIRGILGVDREGKRIAILPLDSPRDP